MRKYKDLFLLILAIIALVLYTSAIHSCVNKYKNNNFKNNFQKNTSLEINGYYLFENNKFILKKSNGELFSIFNLDDYEEIFNYFEIDIKSGDKGYFSDKEIYHSKFSFSYILTLYHPNSNKLFEMKINEFDYSNLPKKEINKIYQIFSERKKFNEYLEKGYITVKDSSFTIFSATKENKIKTRNTLNSNSISEGILEFFHENGKLKIIGQWKNNKPEGKWKEYYENGKTKAIGFWRNGMPEGERKYYDDNGKLKLIAFFQNGNPMGEWRYYDENENLIKTETYKNENSENVSKNYYENKKINSNNLIYTYINEGDFLYNKDSKSIPYEIYYNFRFDFYVDYPTKYFKFLPPPENGDGRAMTTDDDKVYLSFSGMNNIFDTSIEDEYYEKLNSIKPSDIAYKFLGKTFYSLSYYEGDKIIFLKKIYDNSQNAYITLYFEYDKLYKDFMNPIITRMTNSIKYRHNNSSLKNLSSSNQISYVESIGYLERLDIVYDQVINLKNEDYLLNFSKTDLAFIRNTLYARKGYIFKKKEYKDYFENTSWYIGITTNQNILSPDEEKLAIIIKKYETR